MSEFFTPLLPLLYKCIYLRTPFPNVYRLTVINYIVVFSRIKQIADGSTATLISVVPLIKKAMYELCKLNIYIDY